MNIRNLALVVVMTLAVCPAFAQKGKITGKVVDSKSSASVEYASVVLLNPKDSSMVHGVGAMTESNGSFTVTAPYGSYLVRVTFMGYAPYIHPTPVTLSEHHHSANLGKISISPTSATLEAVVVKAERTMVEYQLDKRVVNVDKNIVASGGTATDVLQNVPSVSVDNDGNVSLRGSSNVKVLINGRPSELLASDLSTLLEQTPASSVESVEVITNPSAKYDPEGMSGIINIKLKDKTSGALGLNGVVNLNVGARCRLWSPTHYHRLSLPLWAISASITQQRNTTSFSMPMQVCVSVVTKASRISNTLPDLVIRLRTTPLLSMD